MKIIKSKFKCGSKIICINNDKNYKGLISIGKTYVVETDKHEKNYLFSVYIRTDGGSLCHIQSDYFSSLSEIRKEKLNQLNQCLN